MFSVFAGVQCPGCWGWLSEDCGAEETEHGLPQVSQKYCLRDNLNVLTFADNS